MSAKIFIRDSGPMPQETLIEAIVADLGLEYAETITRPAIVREVLNRGYTESEADAVAEYLGY